MNNYTQKEQGVINLVNLKTKKITKGMIHKEAELLGISFHVLNLALDNFLKFGKVDLRRKNGKSKTTAAALAKQLQLQRGYLPQGVVANKNITQNTVCNILRDYFFQNVPAVSLFKKYSITPKQLYSYIRELNVSGTVLGKKVLDPKKYAKVDVKLCRKYLQKPHLFEDKDLLFKKQLERINTILDKYL